MGEFYVQYEYWFATFQLVMAMLGMGATLTLRDFGDIIREPGPVTLGLCIQVLVVPLVAFTFLGSLGVSGGVAVGIALLAAIPGGTTSNIFTFFARGNSALSISDSLPADFSMPHGQIVTEIGLTPLLPLALGMAYLYMYPESA